MSANSAQWTWAAVSGAQYYDVYVSTCFNPPIVAAEISATTFTLTTLTPNEEVAVYVQAYDSNDNAGTLSQGVTVYTLANPPDDLAATEVGISSMTLEWNAGGDPAGTTYQLEYGAPETGVSTITLTALTTTLTGLSPGASYFVNLGAVNGGGIAAPASQGALAYTLAAPPTMISLFSLGQSSATLRWCADGNPAGTTYEVFLTPAGGAQSSVEVTTTSATFTGLVPFTDYGVSVSALNPLGAAAASTSAFSFQTLPTPLASAPAGFNGASDSTSTITWVWDPLPSALGYQVYLASGGSQIPMQFSAATSYGLGGLAPNQPETAYVQGENADGFGPISQAVTVYTLAAAPAAVAIVSASTASLSLQWNQNGNPPGTVYDIQLSPYPDLSPASVYQAAGSSAAIGGLSPGTTYFLTVEALNGGGIVAPSGVILATATARPPVLTQTVYSTAAATVSQGLVSFTIPAGTFAQTVTLTLSAPASYPEAPSDAQLTGTGVGIQVSLDQNIEPRSPVELSIGYAGASLGSLDPSQFVIARYDPNENVWVPLPSAPDTQEQRVVAQTGHLSLFQIMAATPADSLSAPKVFPNPFRPSLGETAVTFANLPAYSDLKIFDLLGEKVRELQADASGMATWDGKNGNGEGVATGVYFVVAGSGSARRTMKVGVVR